MPRLLPSGRSTACAWPWLRCTPQNPNTSTMAAGPQLFSVCRTYCSGPSLMLGGLGFTAGSVACAAPAGVEAAGAAEAVLEADGLACAGALLASKAGTGSCAGLATTGACTPSRGAGTAATPQP